MSRGKILLIVIPAAMAVGVVIALLFLSSLNDDESDPAIASSAAPASSAYWTGATAGSTPMMPDSAPVVESVQEEPTSVPAESASVASDSKTGTAPTDVPTPGGFSEAPTISVDGSTVTVTFKTTADSTVNSILSTTGDAPDVRGFYDYVNRDAANDKYLEKKATYNVGPEGETETYTLPDTGKSYWILINTVDNASGQWQSSVTAVPIYTVS